MNHDKQLGRLYDLIVDYENYFNQAYPLATGQSRIEMLAEHLLANGVIVPPVMVGQTVWYIDKVVWNTECCDCDYFIEGGFGDPHRCRRTNSVFKHNDCSEVMEVIATQKEILLWLAYEEFGRTVFLTREEAEAKLKEMEEGDG